VVLTALAVRPREVLSAEQLADVLWTDEPPPSWAKVVQGCVVRLRKVLGPESIETTPFGYRLTIALDEIDAQRFVRAVERARTLLSSTGEPDRAAFVLADALSLWRGTALGDVEDWDAGRIEAGRLDELHREAEELYVEARLRAGHAETVLARAEAMLAEQPLRERRWALLALAQYQTGRQTEALATLRRVRSVLNRELGLDPGPELEELEQAVLRQDPSLVERAALPEPSGLCPYQGLLPYDTADADTFFGRDEDVTACLRRLGASRVLAVVGPSGTAAMVFDDAADGVSETWRVVDLGDGTVRASGQLGFRAYASSTSPDGSHVAVTGQSSELAAVDVHSGRQQHGSTALAGEGVSVRYSDDGSRIVTGSGDGAVTLWNGRTLEALGTVYPRQQGDPVSVRADFGGDHDVTIASYDGHTFSWYIDDDRAVDYACQMAGRNLTHDEWSEFLPEQAFREVCPAL
jgi:DNA-binding SARP family transcriptional activator